MRAVIQRVSSARVRVGGEIVAEIERGLLVLLGVARGDDERGADELALRITQFRCFGDEQGRMNLDVAQAGGALLVVSQFTLVADVQRGRRPSFDPAEAPERARALVERFVAAARAQGLSVATGRFGEEMAVELLNQGPVTFVLERAPPGASRTQVLA